MSLLDSREVASLLPAETSSFPSPIPTQFVSSDEFLPAPQTEKQKRVEARVKELGTWLAKRQGIGRRRIFGDNSARVYKFDRRVDLRRDKVALAKAAYEREGPGRTNLRYGYVAAPAA